MADQVHEIETPQGYRVRFVHHRTGELVVLIISPSDLELDRVEPGLSSLMKFMEG